MDYAEFMKTKDIKAPKKGFKVNRDEVHPSSKPHQLDVILWAMEMGQSALFLNMGLGKTHIIIEIARLTVKHKGGRFLIICPLGVKPQFIVEDGQRLGVEIEYVRNDAEILAAKTPILLTNYDRIRNGYNKGANDTYYPVEKTNKVITPGLFNGIALDEATILTDYTSKSFELFTQLFKNTPYKVIATATPARNSYIDFLNYASFLGVVDNGFALTRWFERNSTQANDLTLRPEKEAEFWEWISSWAVFIQKPSDLGYSDEGYITPGVEFIYHRLPVDHSRVWEETTKDGQHKMLASTSGGIRDRLREKRATMSARLDKMMSIVNSDPDEHWFILNHLNEETDEIAKLLPHATILRGSQGIEEKEEKILDFVHGRAQILATKSSMAGHGCNFQYHCHKMIFVGINDSFEQLFQTIGRLDRFMQKHKVECHIIYSESEDEVFENIMAKWKGHKKAAKFMGDFIRENGLTANLGIRSLKRKKTIERREASGVNFKLVNNDSVLEARTIESNSVGFIFTSVPFGDQYEYTDQQADFGHNEDNERFFAQMDYLTPELLRILTPGRLCGIHCKDRIVYGSKSEYGIMYIDRFSDKIGDHFEKHGFIFAGRITITTDVVRENNQTYRLGYTEMCKDGSKMGVGQPEYIMLFRKLPSDTTDAMSDIPVKKSKKEYSIARWQIDAHDHWRSDGNSFVIPQNENGRNLYPWENPIYNYDKHVTHLEERASRERISSGMVEEIGSDLDNVWTDIHYPNVLNINQKRGRVANHICPLPIDIVKRSIKRWSNPGDVVYDPFSGIGTVPYISIKMDRFGYGSELNAFYHDSAVKHCTEEDTMKQIPTMFDILGI